MKIREATIKDLDKILELTNLMLEFHNNFDKYYTIYSKYENHREFYKNQLKKKNAQFVIAENDNKEIMGFGQSSITSIPKTKAPKIGKLISIFVKDEYKNTKIGKKIFKRQMDLLKKEDVKYIEMHVDSRNKKALKIWRKYGFKDYQVTLKMDLNNQ